VDQRASPLFILEVQSPKIAKIGIIRLASYNNHKFINQAASMVGSLGRKIVEVILLLLQVNADPDVPWPALVPFFYASSQDLVSLLSKLSSIQLVRQTQKLRINNFGSHLFQGRKLYSDGVIEPLPVRVSASENINSMAKIEITQFALTNYAPCSKPKCGLIS